MSTPARYRFVFKKVYGAGTSEVQLQELRLVGQDGEIRIGAIENPRGSSPPGEGVDMLVDGIIKSPRSKWLDNNFGANGESVLEVEVYPPTQIRRYDFYTGDDNPGRDPVAWHVDFFLAEANGWFRLDSRQGVKPPNTRLSAYSGDGFGFFKLESSAYVGNSLVPVPPPPAPASPPAVSFHSGQYRMEILVPVPPPPAPASPPAVIFRSDQYKLEILNVRSSNQTAVQLQEVHLFGDSGMLDIASASNPGGCQPINGGVPYQTADNLIDGDTKNKESKWLDIHMADPENCPAMCSNCHGSSELILTLSAPARLRSYVLITANDNFHRDPTSWMLYHFVGGHWALIDKQVDVDAPVQRFAPYPTIYIQGQDSIDPSPSPTAWSPSPPPSAPPWAQPHSPSPSLPPPTLQLPSLPPPSSPQFPTSSAPRSPPQPGVLALQPVRPPSSPPVLSHSPQSVGPSMHPAAPAPPRTPHDDLLGQPFGEPSTMNSRIFWPIFSGSVVAVALLVCVTYIWQKRRRRKQPIKRFGTMTPRQTEDSISDVGAGDGSEGLKNRYQRNPGLFGALAREGNQADSAQVQARVSRARRVNAALSLASGPTILSTIEPCQPKQAIENTTSSTPPGAGSSNASSDGTPAACIRIREARLKSGYERRSFNSLGFVLNAQWRPRNQDRHPTVLVVSSERDGTYAGDKTRWSKAFSVGGDASFDMQV